MTKNPLLNALAATLYITIVASLMFNADKLFGPIHTVFGPIALLSLFTLSVATMGYVFFYQPVLLFLDGHKKEAAQLFVHTLAAFAGCTILAFAALFTVVLTQR